jgi:general stress protein YciG
LFIKLGRPTYSIVKVEVDGNVYVGDAYNCFDGTIDKNKNLKLAENYWKYKENLEGKGFESRSTEEVREIAKKGGKASGEARRKKRDLKACMEALLEKQIVGKDGQIYSGAEAISIKQFEKALKGDAKAFELVRDTSGQSVVQKVQIAEVDADTIKDIESLVDEDDD